MCCKQSPIRSGMSPLPVKLAKITVVLVFFCFAECAAGSCLSYGHACWGAHGKRSGPQNPYPPPELSPRRDIVGTQWFLAKLMQNPPDLRYFNTRDFAYPLNQQRGVVDRQLLSEADLETDPLKGPEEFRSLQDPEDTVLFDDTFPEQRSNSNKLKAKLLDNRRKRMI